jgi:hypothetical protein
MNKDTVKLLDQIKKALPDTELVAKLLEGAVIEHLLWSKYPSEEIAAVVTMVFESVPKREMETLQKHAPGTSTFYETAHRRWS